MAEDDDAEKIISVNENRINETHRMNTRRLISRKVINATRDSIIPIKLQMVRSPVP